MPRLTHELLVQLVRRVPELVPRLMWPSGQVERIGRIDVTAAEFVELNLAERRADVVLALGGEPGRPDEILVIEIQLRRDPRKRRSWPLYVTGLAARFGCPATLVVIAPDRKVARWCARTIDVGRGRCVQRPWVFGPDEIPVITDPRRARLAPELAVLSLAAHAGDPEALRVALAGLAAFERLDDGRGVFYIDTLLALLRPETRAALEQHMATAQHKYYSETFRKLFADGEAKGKAEGKAELLLKQLQLRGFRVSAVQRKRILACTDHATLDEWAARVLTATSLAEVLAPRV